MGDKIEKDLAAPLAAPATSDASSEEEEDEPRSVKKKTSQNKDTSTSATRSKPISDGSSAVLTKAERKEEKRRRKEERKLKAEGETKEERRKRKEERRAHKLSKRAAKTGEQAQPIQTAGDDPAQTAAEATKPGPALPSTRLGGRQAVRQRYIQAKKMAGMNPQALREVSDKQVNEWQALLTYWADSNGKVMMGKRCSTKCSLAGILTRPHEESCRAVV